MVISQTFRRPAPGMELLPSLRPILTALLQPIEAEGAAVIDYKDGGPVLLCAAGEGSSTNLSVPKSIADSSAPYNFVSSDGRPVLVGQCETQDGRKLEVSFWRKTGAKSWDQQDYRLLLVALAALGALFPNVARPAEPAWRGPIDDLTGLPRARKLVEDLPRHWARLDRDGLPGTLIIASVDGLKNINERFGSGIADDLLRQVATFLKERTRPTDVVARIGGDEFAVWLNGVDQFTAAERAERLKSEAPLVVVSLQKPELSVSLSIGVATRQPGSTETVISLMRRADAAMHAGSGNCRTSQETVS